MDSERVLFSVPTLVPTRPPKLYKPLLHTQFGLEARVGIEPTNAAFAEPCLTTWLPRHRNHQDFNQGLSLCKHLVHSPAFQTLPSVASNVSLGPPS